MQSIRQGDVLLVKVDRLPEDGKPIARKKGRIVTTRYSNPKG